MLHGERTCLKPKTASSTVFLQVSLGLVVAFPLGILSALASAICVFGSILPISVFLGLVLPIVMPLVIVAGSLLASWIFLQKTIDLFIRAGVHFAGVANHITTHIMVRGVNVAYMGLYGVSVLAQSKFPEPLETPLRGRRSRLFIQDMPHVVSYPSLPTPPYSSPSYTPLRSSPTPYEYADASQDLSVPMKDPTFSQLSDMLHALDNEELETVASYVTILRKRRSNSLSK